MLAILDEPPPKTLAETVMNRIPKLGQNCNHFWEAIRIKTFLDDKRIIHTVCNECGFELIEFFVKNVLVITLRPSLNYYKIKLDKNKYGMN